MIEAVGLALPTVPASTSLDQLVRLTRTTVRCLPDDVTEGLLRLVDGEVEAGALVIRGVPVGTVPPTPLSPSTAPTKDVTSELAILTIARVLGQPVGYLPELDGVLVQNIVPTPSTAQRQLSTSSKASLLFHTEAAFHPHRPRYLVLLCLRGDPAAATTLASVRHVLPHLSSTSVDALFEPRFRTGVDESYLDGRPNRLGPPIAVLSGERAAPSITFDANLMRGMDERARAALAELDAAISAHHTAVVLSAGEALVIDNAVVVHGRSAFSPRFDGRDRWLQRCFVVTDLEPSAAQRRGRVICTTFGD